MLLKLLLAISILSILTSLHKSAFAAETRTPYVRIAEIEINPAQLENYNLAVKDIVEISVREEPGVLALYAVSIKDDSTNIRVFEIYADVDAYKAHLETAHFKKYKATTKELVKSLKLIDTVPIMLNAKVK